MTIEIKQYSKFTHPFKIGLITLISFLLFIFLIKNRSGSNDSEVIDNNNLQVESFSFIPVVKLNVLENNPKESNWSKAFNQVLNGQLETHVKFGRVDILTDKFAIEIDSIENWKEGVGQCLQYAEETKTLPVLALYCLNLDNKEKLEYIDNFCQGKGIKLIILLKH